MNLQDQIKRALRHEALTLEQLCARLNQNAPNMRSALALMQGLDIDDKHRPRPKEVEVIDKSAKYRLVNRAES